MEPLGLYRGRDSFRNFGSEELQSPARALRVLYSNLDHKRKVIKMNQMKLHKYSAIVMLASALVCIYSGHKMVNAIVI